MSATSASSASAAVHLRVLVIAVSITVVLCLVAGLVLDALGAPLFVRVVVGCAVGARAHVRVQRWASA